MTVSTEVDHNDYTGNGVTTSFPYTFRIFKKSDLTVQVADLNENITVLTLDTDYSVTGAGSYSGGSVVLMSPLANGWQISISRDLPVTQETDLRNQGKFFAEVHEDAFDKLTMLIQQCFSFLRLALRKPSFIASYYDALNNRIRNLRDPSQAQDAATKNYVDAGDSSNNQHSENLFKRTVRVPEDEISFLPSVDVRKNTVFTFNDYGEPNPVPAIPGSASDVLIQLAKPTGANLSGFHETTVGATLDRMDVNSYVKNNPLAYLLQTGGLIQFGIDSLNEGAGNTNYVRYLKILLHSSFDYGGPGFYAFDQAAFQIEGDQAFYALGTFTSLRDLPMNATPAKYAPAGRGIQWPSASGTEQAGADPKLPWDKCNLYYLKQPGGGSFNIKAGGTVTSVNSNADLDLGVISVFRDATNASSITLSEIIGNVVIFALDFIYTPNPRGIRTATIARGGRRLDEFVSQDSVFISKWKAALNPALVVINAGTNDMGQGRTVEQFKADLITYTNMIKPSSSVALIVEPGETSKTTNPIYASAVESYRIARRNFALNNGYYYFDDRQTLGTYENAVSKGWMNDDTHPNVTGNKLRASSMAFVLGANTVVPAEFKYAPRIINTGSIGKITTDFPPVASGAGVNSSKTLWTFGVVGGFNAAIVNVTAFLRTRTTQKYSRIRAVVLISNGTTNDNWATGARILSHEWDNWDAETTSTPSITAAINANHLVEISIAATGDYGFYCSAKASMDLIEAPKNKTQSLWLASSTDSLLFNFTVTS
ncbi:GDSL-type esterase/lipase family protein [Escherichia coli]